MQEFDETLIMAQEKVMAVWFFRGEQPDETWWEKIKPRYPNV